MEMNEFRFAHTVVKWKQLHYEKKNPSIYAGACFSKYWKQSQNSIDKSMLETNSVIFINLIILNWIVELIPCWQSMQTADIYKNKFRIIK